MSYDTLITKLRDRFKLNSNQTLANYKFRNLKQGREETYDAFVIRVKNDAKSCSFKCDNATCSVDTTMMRDQIIFGTHDSEIRRQALHEEWSLDDLIKKGRSLEAATKGAATIKSEPPDLRRTKPGKYSRKYQPPRGAPRDNRSKPDNNEKCNHCTSPRCKGDETCPGKRASCFKCGKKGHFKNSAACKLKSQKGKARKVKEGERSEDTDIDESSSSDTDLDTQTTTSKTTRIYSRLAKVTRVGGARRCQKVGKSKARYNVKVVIREQEIEAFADTGADICVMSLKKAKKLKLNIAPTKMRIKPYGSRSQQCVGEYVGTIMHGSIVTTTTIYIVKKDVETLLSGPVSEDLGIIKFQECSTLRTGYVNRTEEEEDIIKRFPQVFREGIGTLEGHEVKFHIDEEVTPVIQAKRPIPYHLAGKMEKELDNLEKQDMIEEHHGPVEWISNLVLAPKDDGGVRVTVDMRNANKAIQPTHIPIPRAEEIKAQLAGNTVFSKLDFKSAFNQLILEEESRKLTTFYAGKRLMRFKRLTMGSTPASGELTKALNPILGGMNGVYVIHDDVIVAGRDKAEHDLALTQVCERIGMAGMTLNPDKCLISRDSIPWWGMIISKDGVSPDPEKVRAVKALTRPRSKQELKSFFCMMQSNKDFIPNMARKTINMRQLLKNHARFKWTGACQREFDTLKQEFKEDIYCSDTSTLAWRPSSM